MAHTPPPRQTVRFRDGDDLYEFHDGAILELVECRKEIWFQLSDMSIMKRKALMLCKEAKRYGVGSLLNNTYGINNSEAETQESLNIWCRNATSRRGLERWINDEYSANRSDIRKRTIQSVLRAQQKMREENINDAEYRAKVISRLSKAFSQDSRSFALAMGKADELAALLSAEDEQASVHAKALSTEPPAITSSPRSVVVTRRPRASLVFQSTGTDFRNFV